MLLQPPSFALPASRRSTVSGCWLDCVDLSLWRDGRPDLDGVSLRCGTGEWIALVDGTGEAASALLAVIEGRCRPQRGELRWAAGARPALAAVLGQLRWPRGIRLSALLAALDLPESLPLLETLGMQRLQRRCLADLSPFDARVVQLAIADAQSAETLLLDDPLRGLDADASRQMTLLLSSLRRRWPQALVRAIDGPLVDLCDRRVRLDRGRVCRDAPMRRNAPRPGWSQTTALR